MDWWSLGVTAFELKTAGRRPFDIGPKTSETSALHLFETGLVALPSDWSPEFSKVVSGLMEIQEHNRIKSLAMISKTKLMANMKFNHLVSLKLPPPFTPKKEGLNCDPTYELEEMIIESKPLHKVAFINHVEHFLSNQYLLIKRFYDFSKIQKIVNKNKFL